MYINSYWCEACETCWADQSSYSHSDSCPVCNDEIEPFNSETIDDINDSKFSLSREVSEGT
jgi:hypothetical protein